MKPFKHALVSVKKWGGKPEDYLPTHDFLDSSKQCWPDMRHRAILHNSFGIYIAERIFGHNITNSDGKLVSVRDIAEQHVLDDMGRIPTLGDYLEGMPFYEWLGGTKKTIETTAIPLDAPSIQDVVAAMKESRDSGRTEQAAKESRARAEAIRNSGRGSLDMVLDGVARPTTFTSGRKVVD